MSFLEIRDLTYTYPGGIRAVDGLDLDARPGEFVAVVGPNAAGKSTLALLLKGMLIPERGSVRVGGVRRPDGAPDPRVGILFSNPENQIVTSVVEEDIAFGLEVAAFPSALIAGKVQRVMDELGIRHLEKRMPHLLSGGEQQMVALSGVLVQEPDVIVLDEPTTFLDPDGKRAVMAVLRDLAASGKTVILITHDMTEACSADRVVLMERGQVVEDDPPLAFFGNRAAREMDSIAPPFLLRLALALKAKGVKMTDPMSIGKVISDLKGFLDPVHGGLPTGGGKDAETAKTEAAIAFSDIRFRYGLPAREGTDLLRGLDLGIQEGSFTMLCGCNGSGKSTLLQMANGLIEPDEGRVTFKGRPLASLRKEPGSIPGKIALLFQNPERQLFSDMVYDDIAFGPRNLGLRDPEVKRRVLKASQWAGLGSDILDRSIHTLSGGQMRRAAAAGVLAMEPEVLILDEPTDGLDPGGAKEFFERTREYCENQGTTVLIAGHKVPEEVWAISHFSHLEEGEIRSSGPTSVVLTGPGRTVPDRYLPDHLLLQQGLLHGGGSMGTVELDPARAEEKLLGMLKER